MLGVFDIGGTGYRTGMANLKFEILNLKYGETSRNYKEGILKLTDSLKSSGAEGKFEKIAGCIAGKIDKTTGVLTFSPNLPDWVGKPLRDDLKKEFDCEVLLENDAVAEGLGEAVYGAGVGKNRVGYFTAGTGIGGSLVIIQESKNPIIQNLEPGWTVKIGEKFLEEVAGGKNLGDIAQVDWKKEAEMLAMGINKTFENLNPEIIVLGGSLFKSIDLDYLAKLVNQKIEMGKLGQEAGLWGCLKLCNLKF